MKKEHILIGCITLLLSCTGWWFARWSNGVDDKFTQLHKNIIKIESSISRIEGHLKIRYIKEMVVKND